MAYPNNLFLTGKIITLSFIVLKLIVNVNGKTVYTTNVEKYGIEHNTTNNNFLSSQLYSIIDFSTENREKIIIDNQYNNDNIKHRSEENDNISNNDSNDDTNNSDTNNNSVENLDDIEEDNKIDEPMDLVTVIWYFATFVALVAFFVVMACSDNHCGRTRKPETTIETPPPTPAPSYREFAPPNYDSVMEKYKKRIYIIPITNNLTKQLVDMQVGNIDNNNNKENTSINSSSAVLLTPNALLMQQQDSTISDTNASSTILTDGLQRL